MKKIRIMALFLSCLYLTIYIPFFIVTYFPGWYELNCKWNDRCVQIGVEKSERHINELVNFLRHTDTLVSSEWSQKEKHHLFQVRIMFDMLHAGAVMAACALVLAYDRRQLKKIALVNAVILLFTPSVIPFFNYFWRHVIHEILFNNAHWINFPSDVSYYITPRVFFLHTVILFICVSVLINLGLFILLAPPAKTASMVRTA